MEPNIKDIIDSTVKKLEKDSITPYLSLSPTLALIHVENMESGEAAYVKSLIKTGNKYGATIKEYIANSPFEVMDCINQAKLNYAVQGIMIVSDYGDMSRTLYDAIPMRLDIDGLSSYSLGSLLDNPSHIAYRQAPCTAVACLKIMQEISRVTDTPLEKSKVAVIGRSIRVGRPLVELLLQQNMEVSIFHSKTKEPAFSEYTFVVSAIGKPNYWDKENSGKYISNYNDLFLIDVGMNIDEEGNLCGDISPDVLAGSSPVYGIYHMLTPVPGGVGRVTTTVLFAKLFNNAAQYFISSNGHKGLFSYTTKKNNNVYVPSVDVGKAFL